MIKQPMGVVCCDHAVEFSVDDDRPKGRSGAGGRLHHGCRSRRARRLFPLLPSRVLAERAGIPSGVLNVVTGESKEIGGEMTTNPRLRKLSSPARLKSAES